METLEGPYLQFIFIKYLDQVYLNELSEALKIKQKGEFKYNSEELLHENSRITVVEYSKRSFSLF